MKRLSLLVLSLVFPLSMKGSVGKDLETFFHKMGTSVNATAPGSHHNQAAGYYNGGGVSLRNRTKNTSLATIQLPHVRAGCGGIDLFTGGFSFVNSRQLVDALKSIGSNAISYGFMLAMKTMAPSVQSVMAELQDMASKVNYANINSCETAATLLGGVLPKSDLTSRHLCTAMGVSTNAFSSWAEARQGCGSGGQASTVLAQKNMKDEYKNILVDEFNIAWEVLKRNPTLSAHKDLAELCMTLSGTIVAYKEGTGTRKVVTYPSLADHDDLIRALFMGGSTEMYTCLETGRCLTVQRKTQLISSSVAFETRVRGMLTQIMKKAQTDQDLSAEEIAFIGKTRLPIYKLVNVMTAYKRTEVDLRDYTDILCIDLIHQYITEVLDVMMEEAATLRHAQISEDQIQTFMNQLMKAKAHINTKRKIAYEQMNQMLIMVETAKTYERKLEHTFDQLASQGEKR